MQYYGLTGRKYKPDYVGVINANTRYLPAKKSLADEEAYRKRSLDLTSRSIDQSNQLGRDVLEQNQKSADTSALIGLGQLGYSAKTGRARDEKLLNMLEGGGGTEKAPSGTAAPETVSGMQGVDTAKDTIMDPGTYATPTVAAKPGGFMSGLTQGASNWGDIGMSSLVGGTVGAGLGEKYVPFGGRSTRRAIGGAATSGLLSYLSSGDPYTAGISALLGGGLSKIFG